MAKPTQKELAKLRANYLIKREEILKGKVSSLQAVLFEKVYNQYLSALEQEDGKLINSLSNRNLIAGLDKIYKQFNISNNVPVVKSFIKDLNGIHDLNISYFDIISKEKTKVSAPIVKASIDNKLGLKPDGSVKPNGFTDKFINDLSTLKKIKKLTSQALTKNKPFNEFREDLKTYIEGNPKIKDSGGLHQYYRNNAYDTMHQVDRLTQQEFGKRLGLRYFVYTGGLIKTSRDFCIHYNGRILNAEEFSQLKRSDLPPNQQEGIPEEDWKPLLELGGFGCRHSVDWVADSFADNFKAEYNKKAIERAKEFRASK